MTHPDAPISAAEPAPQDDPAPRSPTDLRPHDIPAVDPEDLLPDADPFLGPDGEPVPAVGQTDDADTP